MTRTKALNYMVKELCKAEKGKKQMNAGQAREVIKRFLIESYLNPEFLRAAEEYLLRYVESGRKK